MAIGNLRIGTSVLALATTGLGLTLALSSCGKHDGNNSGNAVTATNPCTVGPATLDPVMPNSFDKSEVGLDCFAWQSFVALNWKADPSNPGYPDPKSTAATFGMPDDQTPKVWETYLEAATVFGNGLKGQWKSKRPAVKMLTRISKTGDLDLSDITQAGGGHHWLTNQRGDITYYEVMMNRDEYEFITEQKFDLTTAAGQLACATQPGRHISDSHPPGGPLRGGLTMPEGQFPGWNDTDCEGNVKAYGDHVGAMEIKAAWTPLPADHSLDSRYVTSVAMITDPSTGAQRQVTVGLVGLHIARKRVANHQWAWATFEHIDNSPDEGPNGAVTDPVLPANPNIVPRTGFTFFGAGCDPAKSPYGCVHNAAPTWCPPAVGSTCVPSPYNAPMQITRLNPVGSAANSVTAWFWSLMPAKSVFNYYRLINVQWPTNPGDPMGPKQTVPLPMGTPMPQGAAGGTNQILSNTTLESFQQSSAACMDCHVYAQIASPPTLATTPGGLRKLVKPVAGGTPVYSSDYSFIFATETRR